MFFLNSRYAAQPQYTFNRTDGSQVQLVKPPTPGVAAVLGYHRRNAGERLDHISARFLMDATQFWRLCDANGDVTPDALAAQDLVGVPIDAPKVG
jgi:hypothetical protein